MNNLNYVHALYTWVHRSVGKFHCYIGATNDKKPVDNHISPDSVSL